jgi:hypothetical protein
MIDRRRRRRRSHRKMLRLHCILTRVLNLFSEADAARAEGDDGMACSLVAQAEAQLERLAYALTDYDPPQDCSQGQLDRESQQRRKRLREASERRRLLARMREQGLL